MKNILVFNNTTGVADVMRPLLASEGYEIFEVNNLLDVYSLIKMRQGHLLIMDVEVKNEDGIKIISEIRKLSTVPIIILSVNGSDKKKIEALNMGADDYVTYPCNPLELLARVKAQIRRYTRLSNISDNIEQIYRVNDLVIDDTCRRVLVEGKEVRLTPIEYKILKLLVQEKGRVFSINQIYESIWHMKAYGAENTIAVHIRHIRKKIERNPKEPQYLKVVWGSGYKVG